MKRKTETYDLKVAQEYLISYLEAMKDITTKIK